MNFTGTSKLSAIDVSNVESPRIVYNKLMGDFDPTDVEFCGDHVMVTLDNNQDRIGGRLVVFKKYNPRTGTMETVLNITGTVRVSYRMTNLTFIRKFSLPMQQLYNFFFLKKNSSAFVLN